MKNIEEIKTHFVSIVSDLVQHHTKVSSYDNNENCIIELNFKIQDSEINRRILIHIEDQKTQNYLEAEEKHRTLFDKKFKDFILNCLKTPKDITKLPNTEPVHISFDLTH